MIHWDWVITVAVSTVAVLLTYGVTMTVFDELEGIYIKWKYREWN